jgi:hypothetical protein
MNSIFKEASPALQGVWSSNRAGISAGGGGAFHLGVVTNIQINFSQQVSRMYDLNKKNFVGGGGGAGAAPGKAAMYYIGGRAEGRATFGRLIGPGKTGCDFYSTFGNICNINNNNLVLTFEGSGNMDCTGAKAKYTLSSPILISVGITQNAQDTMINENAQFMFADMECA